MQVRILSAFNFNSFNNKSEAAGLIKIRGESSWTKNNRDAPEYTPDILIINILVPIFADTDINYTDILSSESVNDKWRK